jgi:hypothetical protein
MPLVAASRSNSSLSSPFWKGEKPIAHTTIFECVMINSDINGAHVVHVVAIFECFGTYCKHLRVMSGDSVREECIASTRNQQAHRSSKPSLLGESGVGLSQLEEI